MPEIAEKVKKFLKRHKIGRSLVENSELLLIFELNNSPKLRRIVCFVAA